MGQRVSDTEPRRETATPTSESLDRASPRAVQARGHRHRTDGEDDALDDEAHCQRNASAKEEAAQDVAA